MPISDYKNRTVDLLAYQGVKPAGDALLTADLYGSDGLGSVCTGIQKLAQRFLIELFTERGSVTYFPNRGTTFIGQLRLGYLRTEQEVKTAFSEALSDIYTNLKSTETSEDPDDELYQSAELISVALSLSVVSLHIRVRSVAGSERTVILPITAMPERG